VRSATSVGILSSTISAPKFFDSLDKNQKNQPFGSELAISTLRCHAYGRPTTKIPDVQNRSNLNLPFTARGWQLKALKGS
jgi:hypothetical protein